MFHGNVRRIQASCLIFELQKEVNKVKYAVPPTFSKEEDFVNLQEAQEVKEVKFAQIENCLERAIRSYQKDNCTWGKGLTHYLLSVFINTRIMSLMQQEKSHNKR